MIAPTKLTTVELEADARHAKQFVLSLAGGLLALVLSWTVPAFTDDPRWCFGTLLIAAPIFATVGARLGGPFEKCSLPMLFHNLGGIGGFFAGCLGVWWYFGYWMAGVRNTNPLPPAIVFVVSPLLHAKLGRLLGIRLVRMRRALREETFEDT